MKSLFTADLHLNIPVRSRRTERTAFDVFAEVVEKENPEVVVVAGDIGTPDEAISAGKRLLVATHTCPWRELNGHPMSGNEFDILSAYSGNSLVGKELAARAPSIQFLMCGHTHMPVRERKIHGIDCLNVGADYGVFRGVVYHTENSQIKWAGEPLPDQAER